MNLEGARIKDYEDVFHCQQAERAETITWTKFPVARASLAYRRLMGTAAGHTAFVVFVALVRLCARFKTGGELKVRGEWITVDDIVSETGIPAKMIPSALSMLHAPSCGWIIGGRIDATSEGASPRSASVSGSVSSSSSLVPEDAGARKSEHSARERAERVWAVCTWRKVSKRAGIMAIQTAEKRLVSDVFKGDPDAASEFLRSRAAAYSASRIVASTPIQYLPHPSTWFNQGRYDDDPREWDRARTGSDADQVPIGGSTLDVMLANMGVDNGQTANGRDGEVPRGNVPAMEGHAGTGARVGDNVLRISG